MGDAKVDTLDKAIEAIDKIVYMGGATASAKALQMVRKVVVPNARGGDTHWVIMFITDGVSNIGGSPIKEAQYLRDKETFEIYAVGKIFSPKKEAFSFFSCNDVNVLEFTKF